MRIAQINAVSYGSTGRIMFRLADALKAEGHSVLCTAGFTWHRPERDDFFLTSGFAEKTVHMALSKATGRIGTFSVCATKKLLKRLDAFQPDLIHCHNLHGWFINLPMLFDYIRKNDIPVVWTLHDCWAFTGHCPHFQGIGCDRWKTGCHSCSLHRLYPGTWLDGSSAMYQNKKKWFADVKHLVIAAPSQWLAGCVGESFLSGYPVRVIPNGIDLKVFSPRRESCNGEKPYTVLGVSYAWDHKKGLDVFLELNRRLGEAYQIALVGTDEQTEGQIPSDIRTVRRTQSPQELAQLYSAADVFVNPTREDNFPTVNMEALACGTPVITFDTGGSPEIADESCGVVVAKNDVDALEREIRRICTQKPFTEQQCTERAKQFEEEQCIRNYLELYRSML